MKDVDGVLLIKIRDWRRWHEGLYSQNQTFPVPPETIAAESRCQLECIAIRNSGIPLPRTLLIHLLHASTRY